MSGCARFPIEVDGSLDTCSGTRDWPVVLDAPTPLLRLSMSVNIIRRDGPDGTSQLTCWHFNNYVVPYLNRVWEPAGIQFWVKSSREVDEIRRPLHETSLPIEALFHRPFLTDRQAFFNIFVVQKTEDPGFTVSRPTHNPGAHFIVIGENSNRSTYSLGRIANTLAHELGHALDLGHVTNPRNLMFYQAAYTWDPVPQIEEELNAQQIDTARARALRGVIPWDFSS